jgi:hypothetical protein
MNRPELQELKLPALNIAPIDMTKLEETLRLYEHDRYGFLDEIPRLR